MRAMRIVVALILLITLVVTVQAVVTLQITVEDSQGNRVPGADIYVAGTHVGTSDGSGLFLYDHAGTTAFNLMVSKTGYQSTTVSVLATERNRTITLPRSTVVLTVLVYDENVAPLRNAIVRVVGPDAEKTGETGFDGKAIFTLKDGETYQIFITALDYRDEQRSVLISGAQPEPITVVMVRGDRFAFRVTEVETALPISGASISIDGNLKGTTGDDGVFSYNLRKGYEYQILVEKPEYQSFAKREYITGDQQVLSISLSKAYHSPFVSAFDPVKKVVDSADVYIDGMLLRKTDNYGRASLGRLTAGTYLLEIRKGGFEPYSQNITVSEDSLDFVANLAYSAVLIRVLVEDPSHSILPGAIVSADGVVEGTTDERGIIFISLTPGSVHTLSAIKDGYHQGTTQLVIPVDGQQDSVTMTLEPQFNPILLGGIVLALVLLGGGVYISRNRGRKGSKSKRFKDW